MPIKVNNFIINGEVQSNTNIEDTIANRHPKDYVPSNLEEIANVDISEANNVHRHSSIEELTPVRYLTNDEQKIMHRALKRSLRPVTYLKKEYKPEKGVHYKHGYFADMVSPAIPDQHLKVFYKRDEITNKTMKSSYAKLLEE